MAIIAIDPGCERTAYCVIGEGFRPLQFAKVLNPEMSKIIKHGAKDYSAMVIEQVASYGMAVGREVFTTCEWIGRFKQIAECKRIEVHGLFRKEVALSICKDTRAGDSNIRRALIDRFAEHDLRGGKGTKGRPDWFYGFAADVWSAYALGVAYLTKGEG